MSQKTKRFILPENEIPTHWYNIQADMVTKPMPPLNPATKEPLKPEDMYPIFAEELCRQKMCKLSGRFRGYDRGMSNIWLLGD